jgi:hypothetical protein
VGDRIFKNGENGSERKGSEWKESKMKLSEVNWSIALIYSYVCVLLYSVWLQCLHICL